MQGLWEVRTPAWELPQTLLDRQYLGLLSREFVNTLNHNGYRNYTAPAPAICSTVAEYIGPTSMVSGSQSDVGREFLRSPLWWGVAEDDSGPLRAVHLSRHEWSGGLVDTDSGRLSESVFSFPIV